MALSQMVQSIPIHQNFATGIFIGFAVILTVALLLNKIGDLLFWKGFVKPFYIRSHRIHHRDVLFLILPFTYFLIVMMVINGLVVIVWRYFWDGIETITILAVLCLVVDVLFDKYQVEIRRFIKIPHEALYLSLPIYAFTHFLVLTV